MLRTLVLVSGGGTNLEALLKAKEEGNLPLIEWDAVVSDREGAYALKRAENHGIEAVSFPREKGEKKADYGKRLTALLQERNPDLILLAGFLTVLPKETVDLFPDRILNIHPALLPKYGGRGFYGLHVHEAVLQAGEKETGATVHLVDEGTDTGRILLQWSLTIPEGITPEALQKKVMEEIEWKIYPEAVRRYSEELEERRGMEKRVLVVGSGGREHAILDALRRSKTPLKLYAAPGNAGMEALAECLPISAMDFEGLKDAAKREKINLVVVGMDDPLAAGITDELEKAGLRVFGPTKAAAELESSKVFSKELMEKYNIPTAASMVLTSLTAAKNAIEETALPFVLKADGLALGKGVFLCHTREEAREALDELMVKDSFHGAGKRIIMEELLEGPEVSVLSFTDGETILPCISAQDHKRAYDGDRGPNTGGMGTVAPVPCYTEELSRLCMEKIYQPTVDAMRKEGRPFKGVIFFGLMLTKDGPKVLEYNARFGDPEAQSVLPLLESDLYEIFMACTDGTLKEHTLRFRDASHCTVMLASGGYPGPYKKGYEIQGLEEAEKAGCRVFHSGTAKDAGGHFVTNGGRVLGVSAEGKTLREAMQNAYEGVSRISFQDMQYRTDIGRKNIV